MRSDYEAALNSKFNVQDTQGVKINVEKAKERLDENYTRKDLDWTAGKHNGDVYISTPNDTHNLIVNHHNDPTNKAYELPESGYPGTSGFFTDEATARKSFAEDGKFDSASLGQSLQQAPYFDTNAANDCLMKGEDYFPQYNANLDCFRVNPDKMAEHFGTTDFNAAIARCQNNTAWGEGGGYQGYNPYINEMINKGALEYVPEKSRHCDNNACIDYSGRKGQAKQEANAVNNYIEGQNIQGAPGERLGHNELPLSQQVSDVQRPAISNSSAETSPITLHSGNAPPTNLQQSSVCGPSQSDIPSIRSPHATDNPPAGPDKLSNITPGTPSMPSNIADNARGLGTAETAQEAAKGMTGGVM